MSKFKYNGDLKVEGDLDVSGQLLENGKPILSDLGEETISNLPSLSKVGEPDDINTVVKFHGSINVDGNTTIKGKLGVGQPYSNGNTASVTLDINGTDAIKIPVGQTSERPSTPEDGYIRYNSELERYEGYGAGNSWGSLGGVKDVSGDTYISAENTPNANNDELRFYTKGNERMRIFENGNIQLNAGLNPRYIYSENYSVNNRDVLQTDYSRNPHVQYYPGPLIFIKSVDQATGTRNGEKLVDGNGNDIRWYLSDQPSFLELYNSVSVTLQPISISVNDLSDNYNLLNASNPANPGSWGFDFTHSNTHPRLPKEDFYSFTELGFFDNGKLLNVNGDMEITGDQKITGDQEITGDQLIKGKLRVGQSDNTLLITLEAIGTDAIKIPVGTNDQRPSYSEPGYIRYNSELEQYEGYGAGNSWGSLGGVKDVSGYTYISAENTPGAGNNELRFYTQDNERMRIFASGNVQIGNISESDSGKRLSINGDQEITGNLEITGDQKITGNLEIIGTDAIKIPVGQTSERPSTSEDGHIRYNSDLEQYEGYISSSGWNVLSGVRNVGGDTYVSIGSENDIEFITENNKKMGISNTSIKIGTAEDTDYNEYLLYSRGKNPDGSFKNLIAFVAFANTSGFNNGMRMVLNLVDENEQVQDLNNLYQQSNYLFQRTVNDSLYLYPSDINTDQWSSSIDLHQLVDREGNLVPFSDLYNTLYNGVNSSYLNSINDTVAAQYKHKVYNVRNKGYLYQSEYALDVTGKTKINGDLELIGNLNLGGNKMIGFGVNGTPAYPLHIVAKVNSNSITQFTNAALPSGYNSSDYQNSQYSIYASGSIFSSGFLLASDSRIKDNITEFSNSKALQKIREIPCKSYTYRDFLNRGSLTSIGFIAQEVKDVIPEAVSFISDYIPDEYRLLNDVNTVWNINEDGTYNLSITDLTPSNTKYRFKVTDNKETSEETIDLFINSDNTFTFKKKWNKIFLYGKLVNDLNVLDKQIIFSVHHAAIQEVDRIQQSHATKIQQLEAKNTQLENTISDLIARLTALENQ